MVFKKMEFIRDVMAECFGCNKEELDLRLDYCMNDIWKITATCYPLPQENVSFEFDIDGGVTLTFHNEPNFIVYLSE